MQEFQYPDARLEGDSYHHDHGGDDRVAECDFGPDGFEIRWSLSTQALDPCFFFFEAGTLDIFWDFPRLMWACV